MKKITLDTVNRSESRCQRLLASGFGTRSRKYRRSHQRLASQRLRLAAQSHCWNCSGSGCWVCDW